MTTSRLPEPLRCAASTSLLSNSNTSNANRPGFETGRNVGETKLQQDSLSPAVSTVLAYCRPSSPQSSSTSSDSGGHRDDESLDEMDDHPQSIKGLESLEPEVSSLHRTALPQSLPIAGDLPSHTISHVTSPSLGFGLSLSKHESSGMPHPSAQYHPSSSPHSLPTSIVQAHIPPSTSSPTLFSAQRGVIHPILTSEGLSATFAQTQYRRGYDSDSEESQLCLWDNCGREFPSLSALVVHLDRDHTLSMVKYVCMWKNCQRGLKPFDARYKLITHLRCHTGEKPYKCEVSHCARSFSRLENLKLHVRTHTGEKPYVCHYDGCNKRFNNTSDRAKHMKTHVTRKPYACKYPSCGKSYTDPSSMRKHIKFAHKLREQSDASGETAASGPGVNTVLSPRRKKSSSSSSSSPRTPQTPSTGITMLVSRPSLTSPTPLTPTVLPTSPPNNPQSALYFPTPLVTSGNNNNSNPGVVFTVAPPTSSLATAPTPSMMQPQMVGMAIQSSPGQRVFFPSGNPQQPLLMVLPSVGSAPNGTSASGYGTVDSRTLQYNGSRVDTHQGLMLPVTTEAQSAGGSREKVELLSNGTASQRQQVPGSDIQVVSNGAATVEEGGTSVENELRKKIALLQQQLRAYQSKSEKTQELPEERQTREERIHVNSNPSSAPPAATVPPPQCQLSSSSPQLMRGPSPNKITLVASSSSSPQVRGQIVALPGSTTPPQFPLAMGATIPTQYTRLSVLNPSSSGQLSHSPSRGIVNASQHIVGMPSREQTVLPQIMLSASPVGAQLLPVSVMQPPGVMAPQFLQLTPALYVNSSKT